MLDTRRAFRPLAILLSVVFLLTLAIPAGAAPSRPGFVDGGGTLKHQTLDTTLARIARASAMTSGAPRPESLAREAPVSAADTVGVTIRVAGAAADHVAAVEALGATVANARGDTIEAFVPVDRLVALGSLDGVLSARALVPPMPQVISQGVALHGVPGWASNGFTGAGVKVGVIDVGFDRFDLLIGEELTQPVMRCYRLVGNPTSNIADCDRITEHGTAVAETLLDVAPEVQLYIANPQTNLDLHDAVEWMIAQGVQVINHSVGWTWEGPGDGTTVYQNGIIAAVAKATAAGITWVNSAGNEGESTWTSGYSDADTDGILEFAPGQERNAIAASAGYDMTFQLRWDDSWNSAGRDLDLFLLDVNGNIVRSSEDGQNGALGDAPYEILSFTPPANQTYYVEIRHFGGGNPGWVQLQEFNGTTLQYRSAEGSVGNPAESANAVAVGAASWSNPGVVESYSSRGPTRDGRIKPDLVGIDFADTVTYGPNGFPGTSQAAPHVAGLAALVKQRFPGYGASDIISYLKTNADHAGAPDNTWGWGLAKLPAITGANPQPVVTALDPASVDAGTTPFTLTVRGSGFAPEAVVRWNGQDRATTWVSDTELRADLPASDLAAPGTASISVFNPAPGGGTSAALTLTITGSAPLDPAAFERTWQRTDKPVNDLAVSRTWMWGQTPFVSQTLEDYAEAPNDERWVRYYDKSRMEINHDATIDPGSIWYVTNGLLVRELITGERQLGDATFEPHDPAQVNVAGDPTDENGPTYATFGPLLSAAATPQDATILLRLARDGTVTVDETMAGYGVTAAWRVQVEGIDHSVASVFWDFMNSSGTVWQDGTLTEAQLFENPFYATGYPITEAYWTTVEVGGVAQNVLVQCFERRCLTYTPDNPDGWKVEAGNVGQHYYIWRYGTLPD